MSETAAKQEVTYLKRRAQILTDWKTAKRSDGTWQVEAEIIVFDDELPT